MKDKRTVFQRRLSYLLWKHDITKTRMAKMTGISRATISSWTNYSGIAPSDEALNKLAKTFKVPVVWLLGLTGDTYE